MTRTAVATPGNSRFERNMKYVHMSWLLFGACLALISYALATQNEMTWHLPLALPVAAIALGYGLMLLVGHTQTLERRRLAWSGGVPCQGRIVAKAPSSFGNFAYWRIGVEMQVAGRTLCFEDRFVYPHVAERLQVGDAIDMRYRPEDPSVFALDMRL